MSDTATKGAEGESIRQKVADMMDYAEPFLEKFPRPEKGYAGLATKIRMCMNTWLRGRWILINAIMQNQSSRN